MERYQSYLSAWLSVRSTKQYFFTANCSSCCIADILVTVSLKDLNFSRSSFLGERDAISFPRVSRACEMLLITELLRLINFDDQSSYISSRTFFCSLFKTIQSVATSTRWTCSQVVVFGSSLTISLHIFFSCYLLQFYFFAKAFQWSRVIQSAPPLICSNNRP